MIKKYLLLKKDQMKGKEVLRCVGLTGNIDELSVYHSFVARIHALIDLIHDSERRLCQGLKRHQVQNRRYGAFLSLMRFFRGDQFKLTPPD